MRVSACASAPSSSSDALDRRLDLVRRRCRSAAAAARSSAAPRARSGPGGRSRPGAGSRCRSAGAPTGSPLTVTVPTMGVVTPASVFSSVVLPEPLSPMIATNSPGSMLSVVSVEDLLVLDLHRHAARRPGAARPARRARRRPRRRRSGGTGRRRSRSPGSSTARARRAAPLTRVPLREPRSRTLDAAVARARPPRGSARRSGRRARRRWSGRGRASAGRR